jgi:hypothetical protein
MFSYGVYSSTMKIEVVRLSEKFVNIHETTRCHVWSLSPFPRLLNMKDSILFLPSAYMLVSCSAYSMTMKMEAACSTETSPNFQQLHGVISQKIEFFITTAVSTSNLTNLDMFSHATCSSTSKTEATGPSEMLMNIYQTTQCHVKSFPSLHQ